MFVASFDLTEKACISVSSNTDIISLYIIMYIECEPYKIQEKSEELRIITQFISYV